jgi:acetyl-CoA carboxylase biotin carboxyl carrier protein
MSTSDQNQPHGDDEGRATGTAAAPQADTSTSAERGARHGRRRRGHTEQRGQTQRRADATLNMDELRELTELFSTHNLTDFEYENADIRIRLSRNPAPVAAVAPAQSSTPLGAIQSATHAAPVAGAESTQTGAANEGASSAASESPEEELHIITSPIVGTFYRSPAPTADFFVKVGSHVDAETVVCIIEAMKLMNEIESEVTGKVAEVLVQNGQPVEFGQPLYRIEPA